jgi:hypothetical protein
MTKDTTKEKKDFKVTYSCECIDSVHPTERFGDWSATYNFTVHSFSVAPPDTPEWDWIMESDVDPSEGDIPEQMHCVWVKYSEGDTFGSSSGNGQIVGLFKDIDKAHALAKSIANDSYRPTTGYKRWGGYFECLESVEINLIPQEKADNKYPKSYKPNF